MEINDRLTHVREYASRCIREEAKAVTDLLPQLDETIDLALRLM